MNIFLCHSSSDKDIVAPVAKSLLDEKCSVFYDEWSLMPSVLTNRWSADVRCQKMRRRRPIEPAKNLTEPDRLREYYGDDKDDWDGEDWAIVLCPHEQPEPEEDQYPIDWEEKSRKYRKSVGWVCECCAIN
jgi:hypothetical protein